MAARSRKFKNILIDRSLQMRLSSYFASLSLALVIITVAFLVYNFSIVRSEITNVQGVPYSFQMALNSRMSEILAVSTVLLLLTIVINFLYGIYISHRIAGPMYAIVQYIKRLQEGHYHEQRSLRPADELGPIMQALHELAKELQAKQK